MERIDDNRFLLFIGPKMKNKSETPINDEITKIVLLVLSESTKGVSNYDKINETPKFIDGLNDDGEPIHYYGYHLTECGEWSTCVDYLLKNNGWVYEKVCFDELSNLHQTL